LSFYGIVCATMTEREQPNEPRRGVAPFLAGIEREENQEAKLQSIFSARIPFGSLGDLRIELNRPTDEESLVDQTLEEDQAYTINLDGTIERGNLRDFFRRGYFTVRVDIEPIETEIAQDLNVSLWINNTDSIFSTELTIEAEFIDAFFYEYDREKGISEQLVLPDNPEILNAVRISVSSA